MSPGSSRIPIWRRYSGKREDPGEEIVVIAYVCSSGVTFLTLSFYHSLFIASLFEVMLGVSRERASERRSREGQGKGPSLARSQEAHFAYPNRRACSRANIGATLARYLIQTAHIVSSLSYKFDKISTDYEPHQTKRLPLYQIDSDAALLLFLIHQLGSAHEC